MKATKYFSTLNTSFIPYNLIKIYALSTVNVQTYKNIVHKVRNFKNYAKLSADLLI